MSTYSAKPEDIKRNWYIIDARDVVLGRLAAKASVLLRGKHKAYYSPNLDKSDGSYRIKDTGHEVQNPWDRYKTQEELS